MIRRVLTLLLAGLLLCSAAPASSGSDETDPSASYTSRRYIRISDDSQFTTENGVVGGTGTAADPYRISGWHIVATWDGGPTSDRAISIGSGVRNSHFVIENNYLEASEASTIGIAISAPFGGAIANNIIVSQGLQTLGIVLATKTDDRQDPAHPLLIEGNEFRGIRGMEQKGFGYSGTSARVTGNLFLNLDVGISVAGARTTGPQFLQINQNDFLNVDWAVPALALHAGTGSAPVVDARHNYYGHPEGPTFAMCSVFLGCHVGPLGEKGAKVAPNALAFPYAEEPFFPDQ